MRILFLSHYFHPEGNAPGTRVYELTRRWAARGHEVVVITGVPNVPDGVPYEGYENRLYQRDELQGVDVRSARRHPGPRRVRGKPSGRRCRSADERVQFRPGPALIRALLDGDAVEPLLDQHEAQRPGGPAWFAPD